MNWYLKCLKQYADFSGRARRSEYWMFTLFNFIFMIVAGVLDGVLAGAIGMPVFTLIYLLGMIIPSISVCARRLHDIDKSGWMMFVSMIPFIGGIWLLILMVKDGISGDNKYGPSPKAATA